MSSILIKNAYIVSMFSPIAKADVLIEDGIISAVGIIDSKADKIIDATGKVLMPGFVNGNTHVGSAFFRGYNDEYRRSEWFKEYIEPIENEMTREDVYNAGLFSMLEMIKSGTTTFKDEYFFEEEVARAAEEIGMRAIVSETVDDSPERNRNDLSKTQKLYDNWHNKANGRIKVGISLSSPAKCSQDIIRRSVELAKKLQIMLSVNYLEAKNEIKKIRDDYSQSVTEYLKTNGVFSVKTMLVHGVWVDELDIDEILRHDTSVIHCPISNCKLGSGIADIKLLKDTGINVGLGTDSTGASTTLDMFEQVRMAAYTQKALYKDSTVLNGEYCLKMATLNGARALGLDKEIGSIEVGKKADLIIIDIQKSNLLPVHNIYSTLAYAVDGHNVETSIIDGKIVMENRKLLTLDEKEILSNAHESVKRLFS